MSCRLRAGVSIIGTLAVAANLFAQPPRVVAVPLTVKNSFTEGIEGPACDADGNVYAVNFERQQTIGKVNSDGDATLFLELPGTSCGNGIRFGTNGTMYIADYVEHQILRVAAGTNRIEVHASNPSMHQPNDLTITDVGTIFASDPDWETGSGRVWRIDPDGNSEMVSDNLQLPNGIEISPNGKILYVAQTQAADIIAFDVDQTNQLSRRRTFHSFDDGLVDGIRCDNDGNLYVARYDAGVVAVLSTTGDHICDVDVLGHEPTNLCFNVDRSTVYVTEREHRRLVEFETSSIPSTTASVRSE